MKYYFLLLVCLAQFSYAQDAKVQALIKQEISYEDKGDYNDAIKTSEKIFNMNPKEDYSSANTIAGLYGKMNNFSEEIEWAERSIKIYPEYSGGYINLGNGYAGEDSLDRAEKCFKKADSLDTKSPIPAYSLGVISDNRSDFNASINYYKESVKRDSTFENGYYNLAAAYANIKDFKDANISILKALQLNPNDKDAQEMHVHIIEAILRNN